MPDPFGEPTQPDEQVQDYLGRLAPLAFKAQPALPVTGAAAVGMPQGPVGLAGGFQASTGGPSAQAGGPGGISPLTITQMALKGLKFADLASTIYGGGAGAMQTPSGQLTFGAPEVLRELQFPATTEAPLTGAEASLAAEAEQGPAEAAGAALNLGSYLGAVPGILSLVQGIRSGDPVAITQAVESLGLYGAAELGLIPTAASIAAGAGGAAGGAVAGEAAATAASAAGGAAAGGVIGGAGAILTQIIADEIRDPHGRRSAVRDYNYIMSQQVPGELQTLQLGAAMLPLISDKLTTDQAMQLYQVARAGLKSQQLLADPLGRQGKSKYRVKYGEFPGAEEAVQSMTPQAWLATVRLEDLLAKRGVTPEQLAPADSPFGESLYGVLPPGGFPWMTPEQVQFYQETMPGGSTEGASLWLTPGALLGQIGNYGGFEQANLLGQWPQLIPMYGGYENVPPAMQNYLYDPATMRALQAMQPGGYEAGLRAYLEGLPGFAGSPLAALWGMGAAEAGVAPQTQADITAAFGPTTYPGAMGPGGGGEAFAEEQLTA